LADVLTTDADDPAKETPTWTLKDNAIERECASFDKLRMAPALQIVVTDPVLTVRQALLI
jgi:hypothetical protein